MAHKALAHPGRLHRGAAAAAQRQRAGLADVARAFARRLVWRQWSIARRHRATLMRHEVAAVRLQRDGRTTGWLALSLAPAPRARCVRHAPGTAGLVAARRLALAVHARCARTGAAAVALPSIAAAAQQYLRAAARAHQQTGGMVDQLPAPRDGSRGRQRAASHWAGRSRPAMQHLRDIRFTGAV
jgi:hypothetical protein